MRGRVIAAALMLACGACLGAPASPSPDMEARDPDVIGLSDVPANAPQFSAYAAGPQYKGPRAAPDVKTLLRSRQYRTMIREGGKEGPNFAGHYTIIQWGCGAACVSYAIIDARSGEVFHPAALQNIDQFQVDIDTPEQPDAEMLQFNLKSRLIVAYGATDLKHRGISYFDWHDNQLSLLRFVAHPYAKH
jgi:hypothetical protein